MARFLNILFGFTKPVTLNPYFGSSSWIECPPASIAPASKTFDAPPSKILPSILGSKQLGNPTIFKAVLGSPPIA